MVSNYICHLLLHLWPFIIICGQLLFSLWPVITLVVRDYICGQLLHLWPTFIACVTCYHISGQLLYPQGSEHCTVTCSVEITFLTSTPVVGRGQLTSTMDLKTHSEGCPILVTCIDSLRVVGVVGITSRAFHKSHLDILQRPALQYEPWMLTSRDELYDSSPCVSLYHRRCSHSRCWRTSLSAFRPTSASTSIRTSSTPTRHSNRPPRAAWERWHSSSRPHTSPLGITYFTRGTRSVNCSSSRGGRWRCSVVTSSWPY